MVVTALLHANGRRLVGVTPTPLGIEGRLVCCHRSFHHTTTEKDEAPCRTAIKTALLHRVDEGARDNSGHKNKERFYAGKDFDFPLPNEYKFSICKSLVQLYIFSFHEKQFKSLV